MTTTLEPSTFTDTEREALFTVCLLAAFADGAKDERERAELQRLVQSRPDGELHAAEALNNVMFKKIDLKEVVPLLTTTEARSRAGEMALCICEADGRITIREHEFLSKLIKALNLTASTFAGLLAMFLDYTEWLGMGVQGYVICSLAFGALGCLVSLLRINS